MLRLPILFFALLLLSPIIPAPAQAPASLQPQYRDQYVGVVHGQMVPLERVRATHSTEHRRMFVITPSDRIFQSIPNPASPVRLPADTHFLIRMETGGRDPQTLIHLQPLKSAKKDREVTQITIKASLIPFGGIKQENATDHTLALNVRDLGNDTLEIVPSAPLPPGEYAFMVGLEAQCFGVDAGSASAGPVLAAAPSAPAAPQPPSKPASWKVEDIPEISTTGQDVIQSTAGLMGRNTIQGKRMGAYLSMHCGFPATEYADLLPLEVVLGGTIAMLDVPGMPSSWVDISSFASTRIGSGPSIPARAVAQNRSTGARVRYFLDAEDMQELVDAPGQTLTLALSDGTGKDDTTAEFTLPQDNAPLKAKMNACLEKKAAEAAARQLVTVAACPPPKEGSVLNDVSLKYAGTGKDVKGDYSEEDNSASWKLLAPAKGQAPRRVALSCSYTSSSGTAGGAAAYTSIVPVPSTARMCDFTVQQNTHHNTATCQSGPARTATRAGRQ